MGVMSTALRFETLRRGDAIPPFHFAVSAAAVRDYLAATGERNPAWNHVVPPLALGAFALAGLMDVLPLPAGALHAGQEFEFLAPVPIDATVEAAIHLGQRTARRGSAIFVFAMDLTRAGVTVARGSATVVAPIGEGSA